MIKKDECCDVFVCSLHCNHLIQGFIVALIGLHVLSAIYSLSILLRQGGYFLRVVLAVRAIVHNPDLTVRLLEPGTEFERALSRDVLRIGAEYDSNDKDREGTLSVHSRVCSLFFHPLRGDPMSAPTPPKYYL